MTITNEQKDAIRNIGDACNNDPDEIIVLCLSIITSTLATFDEERRRKVQTMIIDGFRIYRNSGNAKFSDTHVFEH